MTEFEFAQLYESAINGGDTTAAFNVCEEFISFHPHSAVGFWKKATLHARLDKFHDAIKSIDEAVRLKPNEARYHFFRGWWNFEIGSFAEAEADQSYAIKLEKDLNSSIVIESAYFFRALARLRLQHYEDALSDARQVSDDFLIYLKSEGKVTIKDIREYAQNRMSI